MTPPALTSARPSVARRSTGWGVAWVLLGLLAAAAAAPGRAWGAEPAPAMQRFSLKVTHELGEVLPLDLEHSGRKDLVVVEVDRSLRDAPPLLEVLRQTPAGFEPVPSAAEPLPAALTMVGVGTFRQGAGLVLLTPAGVEVRIWRDGKFRAQPGLFLPLENLFPKAGGEPQAGLDWVVDLDGDGFSELVVPRLDGYHLVVQNGGGALVSRAVLRTRSRGELLWWYHRQRVAYDLPAITYVDLQRSGWKSVVTYANGLLSVFHLGGASTVLERKPDLEVDLQPPEPFDPKAPWDPPLLLIMAKDLNKDGKLDLVFSKAKTGDQDLDAKTRILVYYGHDGPEGRMAFSAEPDQVYALEGFTLPILLDLNNDGDIDLVLVNVEFTFWTALKAIVARSVSADAALYRMREGSRYPKQPDEQGTFSVKFSLGRFSHQPIAAFGDLNGDGLPDLLLSSGRDELGIHWGRKDGFWKSSPDEVVKDKFPIVPGRMRVLDLDGDGRDDLLITYIRDDIRQMPEVNRTFTVLLSRFPRPGQQTAGPGR